MSDITLVWMFLARLVFKVYESKHVKCQMLEVLFFSRTLQNTRVKCLNIFQYKKLPSKFEGPPFPQLIKASALCLKNPPKESLFNTEVLLQKVMQVHPPETPVGRLDHHHF